MVLSTLSETAATAAKLLALLTQTLNVRLVCVYLVIRIRFLERSLLVGVDLGLAFFALLVRVGPAVTALPGLTTSTFVVAEAAIGSLVGRQLRFRILQGEKAH